MPNLTIDVKQKGKPVSAYIEAPFDEGLKTLKSKGYRLISLEENARLRIQEGKDACISQNGNFVREGMLYVPNKGIFLTKNSPILEHAKEATNAHRNGNYFHPANEQIEQVLEDSVKVKDKEIPTNRFNENELTAFAFGKIADDYGKFLQDNGIKSMSIWTYDIKDKPTAEQVWFWDLGAGSVLNGYYRALSYCSRLRGVRDSVVAHTKNLESKLALPTLKQVLKASRQYVPESARKDFEADLRRLYKQ